MNTIRSWLLYSLILSLLPAAAYAAIPSEDLPEGVLTDRYRYTGPHIADEFVARGAKDAKKVAVYLDNGVWDLGMAHFKLLLQSANYSYKVLSAKDIQSGQLTTDVYDMLLMPGGKSWIYLDDLGETGAKAIRDFVAAGGGYLGTCAGAFYATSNRKDSRRNNTPYGIGLLEGTAYDGTALRTRPFVSGMMNIDYHFKEFKQDYRVLLLGGPGFIYTAEEARKKNIRVLANFEGFASPAMISLNYGQGRVVLVGPHGEIEEGLADAGRRWKDADSEWPILKRVMAYLKGGEMPELRSK